MPVRINGATSGSTTIAAPDTGSDETIVLSTALASKLDASAYSAPGLAFVTSASFTSSSSVAVNSCFTSTYRNYRVVINYDSSAAHDMELRLRASGSNNSSNNYGFAARRYIYADGTAATQSFSGAFNSFVLGYPTAANTVQVVLDVFGPQVSERTGIAFQVAAQDRAFIGLGQMTVTTAYDGFTFFPSAGTITGSLRVFGYRNS